MTLKLRQAACILRIAGNIISLILLTEASKRTVDSIRLPER